MAKTLETSVMIKVSAVIGFIKDEVKNNLVEASNRGMIQIDRNTLEKTCNIVNAAIESGYFKSMGEVTSVLKNTKK